MASRFKCLSSPSKAPLRSYPFIPGLHHERPAPCQAFSCPENPLHSLFFRTLISFRRSSPMSQSKVPSFPMAEAKKIVEDLFEPNAALYWADFLFNAALGWTALVLAVRAADFSWLQ